MSTKRTAPIAWLVLALWRPAVRVGAQATVRSPEAALSDLSDGRMDNPALFVFDGCPQDDSVGRAVFEAVRDVELPPERLEELANALNWRGQYGTCGYEPLDTWFLRTFDSIIAQRSGRAVWYFVRNLRRVPSDMEMALLSAAEDEYWDEPLRTMLATVAVFNRPRDRQVEEALVAFRRDVPTGWIFHASLRLSRDFGSTFFTRLASEAPTLPDAALDRAAAAVANEVLEGRVDPDADGMDALRSQVRTRSAIPPWNQIPEGSDPGH